MLRKLALMMTLLIILTSCANSSKPENFGKTLTDYDFNTKPLDKAIYSMMLETTLTSLPKDEFLISILDGTDTTWLGDDDWNSNYNMFQVDDQKVYATVKLATTPPDLKEYFKVTTDEEVADKLAPMIFSTIDTYTGLRRAVVDDFGYKIVTDIQGKALGWNAFFIEFIDESNNNHAMRFYMSNDEINEKHVSLVINADIPTDKKEIIEAYRKMIFSVSRT